MARKTVAYQRFMGARAEANNWKKLALNAMEALRLAEREILKCTETNNPAARRGALLAIRSALGKAHSEDAAP